MSWPVTDADLTKLGKAILKGAKGIVTAADVQFGELTLTGPADRIVEALIYGILQLQKKIRRTGTIMR